MQFSLLALFFVCFATLSAANTHCWYPECTSCNELGSLCYGCVSGYALYGTTCYQCGTNCTDCTVVEFNNLIHAICPYTDCKVSGCASCDSTGLLCLECASGYGLYNYSSCYSCPSSCANCTAFIENPNSDFIITACGYTSCNSLGGCNICDVTGKYCYECKSGYSLYDGTCNACPNNQWESCADCIAVKSGDTISTECLTDISDE